MYQMVEIPRVPLARALSMTEQVVADLVGLRMEYHEIGEALGLTKETVRDHCRNAAMKIPGDLPAQARVMAWARGATLDVLRGDTLRVQVGIMARRRRAEVRPHSGGNSVNAPESTDSARASTPPGDP
jgi:DNA-binding CsgD family transcriptional regulator